MFLKNRLYKRCSKIEFFIIKLFITDLRADLMSVEKTVKIEMYAKFINYFNMM